jgi:hypothetical protein
MVIGQQRRSATVASDACSDHGRCKLDIGTAATKHFNHSARFHRTPLRHGAFDETARP